MHCRSLASVVALSCIAVAAAQYSNVVCHAGYSWATNSLNQDPCVVASYLESQCDRGGFTVVALSPNEHYIGPNASEATPCQCNAVVYSLICACAACQDAQYVSWGSWTTNCGSNISNSLPSPPPLGTVVPSWAYLSIGNDGSWNATAAYISATATQLSPIESTSPDTDPEAGKIAGASIGGGIGVCILVCVVVFWMCRRREKRNQKRVKSFPLSQLGSGIRGSSAVFYDPDDDHAPERTSLSSMVATSPPTTPPPVYHQCPDKYADV